MKTWDAIIVGAGIIGLSLAIELRKRGLRVLIVEKGEPGREASWAAGGMLADFPLEMPAALQELATASARMSPEFVHELEDESGLKIDLRDQGALLFRDDDSVPGEADSSALTERGEQSPPRAKIPATHSYMLVPTRRLREIEPNLETTTTALFLKERSVDPRGLTTAAIAAAKHRGVDFSSGDEVLEIEVLDGKARAVRTNKTRLMGGIVINCAGAWSGQIGPIHFPTRPVKGQMLCVAQPEKETVRHVVRAPDVYLIPRSDGRLLIGATQEEAGFDKRTVPETIQKLHRAALELVPKLAEARMLEAWAGLRPGTPDDLPILGATEIPGYFVATGHFRDGILLAPITARVMGQVICGQRPELELMAFGAGRFRN